MFGAGSDTTASALSIAIMAAACYPKQAKLVQEELDRVIGRERCEFHRPTPDARRPTPAHHTNSFAQPPSFPMSLTSLYSKHS